MKPTEFEKKLDYIRGIRLRDLEPATLQRRIAAIQKSMLDMEQQLDSLKQQLNQQLAAEDAMHFRHIQQQSKRLGDRWKEAADELDDTQNALLHRQLEDRMSEKLGGRSRIRILDGMVVALIILVLSLLFLDVTQDLPADLIWKYFVIDTVCCVFFLADFFFRMSCATSKWHYFKTHWIDFVTSIPIPPGESMSRFVRLGRIMRVTRFVRMLRLLRFLRVLRVLVLFWRGIDKLKEVTDVKLMKRSLRDSAIVLFIGGIIIVYLEGTDTPVATIAEGLWWSFSTMVVGGYGDIHNPMTGLGRGLTVILVFTGMILTGIFTATLTAIVVGDESGDFQERMDDMKQVVDDIQSRLDTLDRSPDSDH